MNHQSIYNTHTQVTSILDNDDGTVTCLDSDNNEVNIDMTLVNKESDKLQAEHNSTQYSRDRKVEYPSIEDQLDYIYHNGVDAWKADMISPIKDKYPITN